MLVKENYIKYGFTKKNNNIKFEIMNYYEEDGDGKRNKLQL